MQGIFSFFDINANYELQTIIQAVNSASHITISNSRGDITYANDKFCEISKFNRAELIGQNHRIHKSGHHTDEFYKELWESISSGKVWSGEIKNRAKNGSFYWVLTTIFPITDHNKNEPQYIAIRFDITEKKELEERLYHFKDNLDKMIIEQEMNEEFLSTIGHDLKTPLTIAKFSAQIIEKKNSLLSSEKIKSLSAKIVNNINRVDELISEILDSIRLKNCKTLSLKVQSFDMLKLTNEMVENFVSIYGALFKLVAVGDLNGHWCLSSIKRILENLLTNAVKYSNPNSLITISLKEKDNQLILAIHNEGNPISESDQKIIFNYLQRTTYAQMSGQTGYGIGLTIVKGLTELHRGKISVTSTYESGTTFTVTLPKDCRCSNIA